MIDREVKNHLDSLAKLLFSIRSRASNFSISDYIIPTAASQDIYNYVRIVKSKIEKEADEALISLYKLEDKMKSMAGDSWPSAREIFVSPDGGERTDGR